MSSTQSDREQRIKTLEKDVAETQARRAALLNQLDEQQLALDMEIRASIDTENNRMNETSASLDATNNRVDKNLDSIGTVSNEAKEVPATPTETKDQIDSSESITEGAQPANEDGFEYVPICECEDPMCYADHRDMTYLNLRILGCETNTDLKDDFKAVYYRYRDMGRRNTQFMTLLDIRAKSALGCGLTELLKTWKDESELAIWCSIREKWGICDEGEDCVVEQKKMLDQWNKELDQLQKEKRKNNNQERHIQTVYSLSVSWGRLGQRHWDTDIYRDFGSSNTRGFERRR
jgi:hypothetical protein